MQKPITDYMKIGLVHFMAYPDTIKGEGPVLETISKIAADDYFDVIEHTWIKDADVRRKALDVIKSSGLINTYGGQPLLLTTKMNINDTDEKKRMEAVDLLKKGIDEAYEMGAAGFAFLSGNYEEDKKRQSYTALINSTEELCAYAAAQGDMKVVLEVFDYDIDKKSLIGPASLAREFAQEIGARHNNFGLMVDLSHIPMIHETVEEHILPLKDYIVHAHMGNTVIASPELEAYGDTHPRFGFPGSENDVNELAEYLRVLLRIGYLNEIDRPIVSFEVKPWGSESSAAVIANAKRALRKAWSQV